MDGQGLQPVRSEIEAIVTFQAALNRLALHADENALTEWTGPRPEDVDALAGDDGTFSRAELNDVRKQAAAALSTRFREVLASLADRPVLYALLKRAVLAGTGGVVSLDGPEPEAVLAALTRTGAIRQDWAQTAANMVREALLALPRPTPPLVTRPSSKRPAAAKRKKAGAKKAPLPKKKSATKKKAATKRQPARAKKALGKKPITKKAAATAKKKRKT